MPFTTNDPKINRKGRPAGRPNIATDEVRAWILRFLDANVDDLQSDYDVMSPREKLTFIEKLLKHVLPAPLHPLQQLSDAEIDKLIFKLKNNEL
jgi:hypothetical protein